MMHVFPFSPRKGTVAMTLPDPVPEAVKQERSARLISAQKEIRNRVLNRYLSACGTSPQAVLFETYDPETKTAFGHTASFVGVQVASDIPLHAEFRPVRLTAHDGNVCTGVLLPETAPRE
jgi:threonylcarbamoyladenosine tRNA methylthiotransferase MtaB